MNLFSHRLTRPASVVAIVGLACLAIAGCTTPSNNPSGYNDQVQTNFVDGCTGNFITADGGTTTTLASSVICACSYAVFYYNVPYDDTAKTQSTFQTYSGETFLQINDDLKKDPNKFNDNSVVPQAVRDKLNQCKTSNGSSQTVVPITGTTLAAQ